jgi:hypothetical protein
VSGLFDEPVRRCCSTCGNWNGDVPVASGESNEPNTALCCVDRKLRRGSERCGAWVKDVDWSKPR